MRGGSALDNHQGTSPRSQSNQAFQASIFTPHQSFRGTLQGEVMSRQSSMLHNRILPEAHGKANDGADHHMQTIRYGLSGSLLSVALVGTASYFASGDHTHNLVVDIAAAAVGFAVVVALRFTQRI